MLSAFTVAQTKGPRGGRTGMSLGLNFSTVATLFRTELRMVLRDRRILLTSILLPLLITPLMFLGSNWSIKKREHKLQQMVCRYAVAGPQAEAVRALLAVTRERCRGTTNAAKPSFQFEEVRCADPKAALNKGEIHLVLEWLPAGSTGRAQSDPAPGVRPSSGAATTASPAAPGGAHARAEAKLAAPEDGRTPAAGSGRARTRTNQAGKGETNPGSPEDIDGEASVAGVPAVRLVYRADRDESSSCMARMQEALRETRRAGREALLQARGFPATRAEVAVIREVDLASKSHVAGLRVGRLLTLLLLVFILSSGAVVAIDSLAGEKERGTLETLLTTGASRVEIIAAKHLVILSVALVITLIQALNFLVYVGFKLLPGAAQLAAAVPPQMAVILFLLLLPVAALASSVLLLLSGYARSYKEAQFYFLPVFLLGLLPALAPLLPGLSLRSAIVLVPIANIALAARELLTGVFDWPMIALAWVVTAAAAVWTTRLNVRFLSAEKLITAADTDAVEFAGGPALFGRQVLRWFAVLWAVLLLVNNHFEKTDLRVQLLINLVVLFFGASCLMLRHYRLNPREALALRAPKPVVWLAVLLGVPGGLLTAAGLFRLVNLFIPVSSKTVEQFSETLGSTDIPPVQILFFMAVLPGIFEEITFRGVLLHGLRQRLHPAALALVVGLVFGLFHVALFRLAPTAWLGVLLAALTLLSGSIFPAMLWHCLNNATALFLHKLQIPVEELDPASYLLGAGMLAAAFWLIWRARTPYPGLRPWRTKPRC